jgi:capsular polysaccharide export protein
MISSQGVHYDSGSPSELEVLITRSAYNRNEARFKRARSGIRRLRERSISKFNHAPSRTERELGLDPSRRAGRVLVIDQTRGDSSIMYGKASGASFTQMLAAARRENMDA